MLIQRMFALSLLQLIIFTPTGCSDQGATSSTFWPWQATKKYTALTRDFLGDNLSLLGLLGTAPLEREIEAEVRTILKDLNFKHADTIRIRRMSKCAIYNLGMGPMNACVVEGVFGPHYLFVCQDWFKTLSKDEKYFLLGHEAAHITQHHFWKTVGALCMNSVFTNLIYGYFGYKIFKEIDLQGNGEKNLQTIQNFTGAMYAFLY